jgi:hypothetical protein
VLDHFQYYGGHSATNSGVSSLVLLVSAAGLLHGMLTYIFMVWLQDVIEANLFPPMIDLLRRAEFDVKKEAAWAISNATSGGSDDQLRYAHLPRTSTVCPGD